MITIRTMKQIATSRSIPSFRSAGSRLVDSSAAFDQARMDAERDRQIAQESLRQWRSTLWSRQFKNR
ncbi:MAG: hypothetical protein IGR76_04280 [Synechococcales cyanobacterium T60_A2020_003]|nr:hypothetical protein [Synechococcales cyanobacterium T60_A2020_003]